MLSHNEEEDLDNDDLEGSSDEIHIFKQVFLGRDNDMNDNRGLISGIASEGELSNPAENLLVYNCENSAITSQEESFSAKEELKENNVNWFPRNTGELLYSGHHSVGALPISGPSKRIPSGTSSPAQAVSSNFVTCQLVESSSKGITSSCLPVKQFAENCMREVDASKTISPPVYDESSANKLLVATPTASDQFDDKTEKYSQSCEIVPAAAALNCGLTNNPKPFLRNLVQELLRDAGWNIGRRERKKIMGEYLYYSPWRRKPIRDFTRVWNLCGRRLFTDAKIVLQEDKKQWADLVQFCSDMYNTGMEIERELSGAKTAATLTWRWHLLDPFVNVVFIDKKLSALKVGKSVNARRSSVKGKNKVLLQSDYMHINGKRSEEKSEDQLGEISVVNESALTVYQTNESSAWCKELSGHKSQENMTLSKASGADHNSDYSDSCLFEVPISYEDANIVCGGSEIESPGHECDKFFSRFDRHRFDDNEIHRGVKEYKAANCYEVDETFDMQINENIGNYDENSYMMDADIKFLPDSYRPESCKNKKNILLEHTKAKGSCIAANGWTNESRKKSLMTSSGWRIETRRDVKLEKFDSKNNRRHRHPSCQLDDDDICFPAIRKSKSLRPSTKRYSCEIDSFRSEAWKKHKGKRESCRLVPRHLIKGKRHSEGGSSLLNARTVLSWLVDRGVISLGDTIQCRRKMDDTVVKYGLITRDGILCECCSALFPVHKFSTHAGFRRNHHLYMKSGKSFMSCQLEAWSAEYKARESAIQPVDEYMDMSDDKCGICGDMGELICCDNCPSTFHLECLEKQELPRGSWYCVHCSCSVCDGFVENEGPLRSHGALKCLLCEHKYHRTCLEEKGCKEIASDDSFCCQSCQEVYEGLNFRIGFVDHLSDGFSWTLLKCIHEDQRGHSAPDIASVAECNTKLAVALTIMEECLLPIVDSRTGIDMIPHVVYNWRSQYPRLNYNGFYAAVLEKDDMLLSVASFRIHGVTVAEMPLVATCSTYQRQGMFRRLLHSVEELLKLLKVEKIVVSAIPSLVEMWTIGFGFTPVGYNERKSLRDFNLMVFPGTVLLKKHIYGSPKTLQVHPSSSIRKSLTERTRFPKWPVVETQIHPLRRSSANEVTCKMEMAQMNSGNMGREQDQRQGSLYKHLLKLPWGEPDSSVGRIRIDVSAARENVRRISQRAHASHDIC